MLEIIAKFLGESNGCTSSASTSQTSNEGSTEAVPSEQVTEIIPSENSINADRNSKSLKPKKQYASLVRCRSVLGKAYSKPLLLCKAIKVFRQMEVNGVKPDCMTLVSALSACARSLMSNEGLQSLFPMEDIAVMGIWELLPHLSKFKPAMGMVRLFVERATGGFKEDTQVGKGSFSCVFKGILKDGTVVVVKRAIISTDVKKNSTEFHTELDLLSRLNHAHLLI
ncbi:hypothetical protein IFM89_036250 [Coptis chinensis]|uniref:Protein kinase domain-containing protein n=1 Tax=Coptis chinensis TaxID=261450 RepID=A0A835LSQ1_9MAGN|nr:hypothetical protein IFM89_036250 [Coptis chinensis]